MERFLLSTFAGFALMQLALAELAIDSESNRNSIIDIDGKVDDEGFYMGGKYGIWPENLIEPMWLKKPVCSNPRNLLENLDYLSGIISSVELYDIIDPELIKTLQSSVVVKQKELIEPMEHLVAIAKAYEDALNPAADQAVAKLANMTDAITFDTKTANLFDSQIEDVKNDQVTEGCKEVEKADEYLKGFNTIIEESKKNYAIAVSPNLLQITNEIEELSKKYNEADINFEAAKQEIEKLETIIKTETEAVKNNTGGLKLEEFVQRIKEEGCKCEEFFEGFHGKFVKLLKK
ncbi:uncharacterized protein LOC129569753 [Sitodiplosis mosellana]|uniref:uncharacterized protein LOC129569753 n=1 Tax=Sitodiplosis mosellana TaxID=263140 RepID=UPI002444FB86|nr:uncharacterized protein LOC129569753 [Sitodiplosis mosellana]